MTALVVVAWFAAVQSFPQASNLDTVVPESASTSVVPDFLIAVADNIDGGQVTPDTTDPVTGTWDQAVSPINREINQNLDPLASASKLPHQDAGTSDAWANGHMKYSTLDNNFTDHVDKLDPVYSTRIGGPDACAVIGQKLCEDGTCAAHKCPDPEEKMPSGVHAIDREDMPTHPEAAPAVVNHTKIPSEITDATDDKAATEEAILV